MSAQNVGFLTLEELAKIVRVDKRTVVRWRAAGMPCSVSRGTVVRVDLEEVKAWLKNRPAVAAVKESVRQVGRPRNVDRDKRALMEGS
ncbi:helix-turn-helix transcriptional regulator [Bosea sp. (in: a-proteobacteria)]|uniref:helix-turn-helix transcriptional regulator n=1 Tax=Bosea sp. (in: a-proteobacteria) TaxID=1871050 RepID=UPI003F6FB890